MKGREKRRRVKLKRKIHLSMPDGEGGVYGVEKVEKFLKGKKSDLKPGEISKDFNLLSEFHKKHF